MKLFSKSFDFDLDSVIQKVNKSNLAERYCLFFLGIYINALAFNLFFDAYNIVAGGTTGLAIVINELFGISTSVFVFLLSFIILIIGYFLLGKKYTANTVVGLIVLPIFIQATSVFNNYIDFGNTSMLAIMIFGGALSGFSNGLIMKTGFSVGGMQTIYQIMNKYLKISIGNASLIVNVVIIALGSYIFGINNAIYAVIALYVSSMIMDRVILGISDSKAFYIVTSKEKEVKEFIINKLGHSATLLEARGGYTNKKTKVILCVIPTREYSFVKEVISEIDDKAFYIITDSYEVKGGI